MSRSSTPEAGSLRKEIERGLTCAWQAHYADAATHFARARDQVPDTHPQLVTAFDAFVQSHARYWQAEQGLHEASRCFAVTHGEQQARLEELQRLLSATIDDLERSAIEKPSSGVPQTLDGDWMSAGEDPSLPALSITCFGRFEVRRAGVPVPLCQNRNGQAILRYLVAHPRHRETMDVLLEALWPQDPPEVARHKLHVAVSALRRAMNGGYAPRKGMGYLLCEEGAYQLNPAVSLQIDVEEFLALYSAGQREGGTAAISHYEAACRLYAGPFLSEDIYADWSLIRREQLTQIYLSMCGALGSYHLETGGHAEAAGWARTILEENRCDEAAYRQLMQAYAAQGRRSEALRQFQRCERVLADELGVQPMSETKAIFQAILQGEPLPDSTTSNGDRTDVLAEADGQEARSA